MPRPTTKKAKTKTPRPADAELIDGNVAEDVPVATAVAEPLPAEQTPPPEAPEEQSPRNEPKPPPEDRGRNDGKGRDKENNNKDRVAANSINIAKLQAMSMA